MKKLILIAVLFIVGCEQKKAEPAPASKVNNVEIEMNGNSISVTQTGDSASNLIIINGDTIKKTK